MANFSYAEYAAAVAAAKSKESGVKVGFFKVADGGEALVRFDVATLEDLDFASIHRVKKSPEDRFGSMSISCLNPFGHTGECPLCAAVDAGDERVQKVGKRVFIKMMVAYKDANTGAWSAPQPVIWERPAGFYRELRAKLDTYGDLTQHLFKITRTGSSLDTKYSIDYAVPAIFKPEMVPADFSAFEGFDITRHSYWVKTAAECEEYLRTGKFPEAEREEQTKQTKDVAEIAAAYSAAPAAAQVSQSVQQPTMPQPMPQTVVPTAVAEPKPASAATSFGGFSF